MTDNGNGGATGSAPVVMILGSKADLGHAREVAQALAAFDLASEVRIASAHKVTRYLLEMLEEYERSEEPRVYITIAGRSNALSGVVDANTRWPVIACPPYGERFGGMDLLSTVRMPSGIAPLLVLEPAAAALAAAKMLALADPSLAKKILAEQRRQQERTITDDRSVAGGDNDTAGA